jgi:hypothetical protein
MKALEMKGKADKLSDEADRLYEFARELWRDAEVKSQCLKM